jgi:TonB family protein
MKRPALLFDLVLVAAMVGGCGSDKDARRAATEGGPEFALRQRQKKPAKPVEPPPQMKLDNEMGVLESQDVEATLEQHFDEVRACYHRAGKAQRYASGRVLLRFLVAGDGRAEDVWVIESNLGNYDVERCLVEVGRRISFDAPNGRKATTFEYPVEFRSTNQLQVLDMDGPKVDHDVAVFMPQLAACGQLAKGSAQAILYIEPNGYPGSVGLAAAAELDEDVGDCMVQTIRHWRMSATLPGRALRVTFAIPPAIAAATTTADASPRRGASSVASHRRHR